jgi:SSS family solute:Na+ symporter
MSELSKFNLLDLAVVIAYLAGITALGVWVGRGKSKTSEGYFLGGRQFTWVMVGFSLFATNVGIGAFIGGTGMAYRIGVAALTPDLLGGLGLTISAVVFVPLYLRSNITTLPQFLELRYNRWAKFFYGGIFVLLAVVVSPLSMYTGSLAILSLLGIEINTVNIYITGCIIACTAGVYAVVGGLAAVVIVDMVQAAIIIIGSLTVSIVGIIKLGGLAVLFQNAPPETLELLRPHSDPEFPWTAMFTGQLLASCLWAFSNISMLQRVLGAKNLEHAQAGMLLGAFLKMCGFALFVIPGLLAAQLFPGIAPDTAYSTMIRELLPAGISGIAFAGLLTSLLNTQESGVNAMSSIVSIDLYPAIRKKAPEREALLVGKSAATANIIWGIAAAPVFLAAEQGIFSLLLKFGGFMTLPCGLCYLLGRFWRRGTGQGCVATLVTGAAFGAYYIVTSTLPGCKGLLPERIASMHFYHLLPFFAILLATIFVVVSLLTPAPSPEKLKILDAAPVSSARMAGPRPWHGRYGLWWLLYLAAFVGMYLIF